MTVTVLTMALWSVIRILYLYTCISLTGSLTKLFCYIWNKGGPHSNNSMLKIIISENWAEKPRLFYLFVRDPAYITHVEYPWSPHSSQRGGNSETESIHFMQFPATLVQLAEKSPPPPTSSQRGKNTETESIHIMQFPATLVQLAEKPPSQLVRLR